MSLTPQEVAEQEALEEAQKAGQGGTGTASLGIGASGNVYIPAPPNTTIAYSGSDCNAFLVTYGARSRSSFTPLSNLAAISYSVHRDKAPVRRLGEFVARDYTKGSRTVAGTIVLINFDRAAFYELLHGDDIYGAYGAQIGMSDEIPPFDIMLMFAEENKGRRGVSFPSNVDDVPNVSDFSKMWIRGVRLVDEGAVTGTDEAYMETSFQYVAEEVDYLKPSNDPVVIPVSDSILSFGVLTADSAITEQPAKPYRLFEPQTEALVDYDNYVGDWELQSTVADSQNLTSKFSYTLGAADLGERFKNQNQQIWMSKTATFKIDMSSQPAYLSNTAAININSAEVPLSGQGVHPDSSGNTFDIKYNSLPDSGVTLAAEDGGFRAFELESVYLSQADDWADPSAGQPGWIASLFGSQAPSKPIWGNKFYADVHNIGMDMVEEKYNYGIYDSITQPYDAAVGIINMPATEVFWDFTTVWGDTSGADHFRAIISTADPNNGVERDCFEDYATGSVAYRGNALEVHLLETDVLRDETVQVSITLPRASIVYHGSYTWVHADGYTDSVEKTLTFSSDDQHLPFFEAWTDPATYIEAAKDPSFSTLLEVTGASYSDPLNASGDATIKVMVPPPPLIESEIKVTRPAPGFKSIRETYTIETGSTIASQTIVLNNFSLGEEDIQSIFLLVLHDHLLDNILVMDSISQNYADQETTIVLKGMDGTRWGGGSTKIGPSTNIDTATQSNYVFVEQEMYGDVDFIEAMADPNSFISNVDTSTASFDFSNVPTEFQPTSPPIVQSVDLVNKTLRVASARLPRTFNESFTQAGIDSMLWDVLTEGPYIKIADKPDGFTSGSVKFAQAGEEHQAWAAVSLTSLSTLGQKLIDDWGATCNKFCLEANLKYFIPIKEESDGYYLQFKGWSIGFWQSHEWYSKLAEGKVTVPVGMYFCNDDGSCGSIPADLQTEISNGTHLSELDESLASVNVLTNITYMGPIPFSIDYETSTDVVLDSLGVDVTDNSFTQLIPGSWGEVHNFTSSIDPTAAPYDMNASATVELDPSDTGDIFLDTQKIDLEGFHPGVETEVTWEYDYYSLGAKDIELEYNVVDDANFETSMIINLGTTAPVDFDKCDPSSMTLTEVASQGTIDICNNNIEDAQGNSLTVSDPTLNGANWEITISNIPALVLVPSGGFTGFLVNAWNWILANPDSTAPTGELEAVVYLKTVDLSTNATAGHTINGEDLETLSLKLRYDYPATPGTTDTYVGPTEALQISGVSYDPDDPDPFKWTHYYQQAPSKEVRLLLPQGEHGQNTEAFFSDNYSISYNPSSTWGDFSIKDVTNYDTVNNQPQLDFEIYNFPAQAEPITFDLHYQYQLSKLDMNLLYLRSMGNQYPDLITNFEFSFVADVIELQLLTGGAWPGADADTPGKFDVINKVWFVDNGVMDVGDCTGSWGIPGNSDISDSCYWEVLSLDEANPDISALVSNSNKFYYRAADNNLIFPTGLHPSDPNDFKDVIDESISYSVVVDYDQLNSYVPANKYTHPGYIITTRLSLTDYENYVFALDFEHDSITYKTGGTIGTQDDNSFCELLGGTWETDIVFLDSLQGDLSVAGICYDANGVADSGYQNMAECTAISGNKWTPDKVALGVCSKLDLDKLMKEGKLTQFSFWFIGPNSNSSGFYEVFKEKYPTYPNLQTCLTEMLSYYIDHFGVGNLTQQASGTTP